MGAFISRKRTSAEDTEILASKPNSDVQSFADSVESTPSIGSDTIKADDSANSTDSKFREIEPQSLATDDKTEVSNETNIVQQDKQEVYDEEQTEAYYNEMNYYYYAQGYYAAQYYEELDPQCGEESESLPDGAVDGSPDPELLKSKVISQTTSDFEETESVTEPIAVAPRDTRSVPKSKTKKRVSFGDAEVIAIVETNALDTILRSYETKTLDSSKEDAEDVSPVSNQKKSFEDSGTRATNQPIVKHDLKAFLRNASNSNHSEVDNSTILGETKSNNELSLFRKSTASPIFENEALVANRFPKERADLDRNDSKRSRNKPIEPKLELLEIALLD